jgi:hypothetical protein
MCDDTKHMNNNKYYKTTSLPLAAAIQAVSTSKLELVERNNSSQKAVFIFDRTKDPSFDEIVARFWSSSLPIDAATYFNAIKSVKSRLYE